MEDYSYIWNSIKLHPHELKILKNVIKFKYKKNIDYKHVYPPTIAKSVLEYMRTDESLDFDDLRYATMLYNKIKGPEGLPTYNRRNEIKMKKTIKLSEIKQMIREVIVEELNVKEDFIPGKKSFKTTDNVGKSKYTISYHDGKKQHSDGSPFYDIAIFSDKRKYAKKIKDLKSAGYVQENINEAKTVEDAENALRDMFTSKHYDGKVHVNDIVKVLKGKLWNELYGLKNVKAAWQNLLDDEYVVKQGNVYIWQG